MGVSAVLIFLDRGLTKHQKSNGLAFCNKNMTWHMGLVYY